MSTLFLLNNNEGAALYDIDTLFLYTLVNMMITAVFSYFTWTWKLAELQEGVGSGSALISATGSATASKKQRFNLVRYKQKSSRRKREKVSAKRERKATKTLAIVLGKLSIPYILYCNSEHLGILFIDYIIHQLTRAQSNKMMFRLHCEKSETRNNIKYFHTSFLSKRKILF